MMSLIPCTFPWARGVVSLTDDWLSFLIDRVAAMWGLYNSDSERGQKTIHKRKSYRSVMSKFRTMQHMAPVWKKG
eukprot:2863025-Amphidinium_carterae.1